MDIVKTPISKPFYRKYWYLILGLICLTAFFLFARKYQNVTYLVFGDELLVDTVAEGPLSVSVSGYGQLSSKDVYWIGAESDGRVERILVKPGDSVKKGDVLLQLVNPQLLQQLKDAELEFDAQKADTRANQIARETQLLHLRTETANAEIDHQTAKMDLDAKIELMANGMEIISRLDFERTQLTVQKYKQRWEMQQQSVTKSEESMIATGEAQHARLLQTANELDKVKTQVQGLAVRATVGGIIQEMELELGQQIGRGENITRIARPDQLVAEIQIQELQVNDVQIGMRATVDTRSSIIEAVVSRIDPAVVESTVLVEIELLGKLPPEVRPDLNVEATINVAHIEKTVYVKRPVFARAFSQGRVYRLNAEGDIAERVSIGYGQASTTSIEILEGAQPGDRLIVSDSSAWDAHDRILIR